VLENVDDVDEHPARSSMATTIVARALLPDMVIRSLSRRIRPAR
jgi:hypothetical protein